MSARVLILGAGLAGLAAASSLAPRGFRVRILESRLRTGGRASSFSDPHSGQLLDACQHVSMGCCTNLAHFCRIVGISHLLEPQRRLFFMTPDRRISPLAADPLPAPFHLTRSFLQAHYLSLHEKVLLARGLAALRLASPDQDPPFVDWLTHQRQTPRTMERFWGIVLVSALNEEPQHVGLKYARKVFVDAFLRHPRGFQVEIPRVPLGELYGRQLDQWFAQHRVTLSLNHAVRRLILQGNRIAEVELRSGERLQADWYISAVPFDRFLELLPEETITAHPSFANLRQLQTSPITSAHLWYDLPVCPLPHVVLLDSLGQWVFNRGVTSTGEHYLQIVISASAALRSLGHEEILRRLQTEMASRFPRTQMARLLRARVVTEHHATFRPVPGVDRYRPSQLSPLSNLFLAGDWTATEWPATMEGAVRSGYLAAQALLHRQGVRVRLLQPDL